MKRYEIKYENELIELTDRDYFRVGPIERAEMERCEEIEHKLSIANMRGNK